MCALVMSPYPHDIIVFIRIAMVLIYVTPGKNVKNTIDVQMLTFAVPYQVDCICFVKTSAGNHST